MLLSGIFREQGPATSTGVCELWASSCSIPSVAAPCLHPLHSHHVSIGPFFQASIDDGTAGQISASCLQKANALVQHVRQALSPAVAAAEAGSTAAATAASRSRTVKHVKLVLKVGLGLAFWTELSRESIEKNLMHCSAVGLMSDVDEWTWYQAVFSTLLELFRISRPSAHAAVGLKLLLLVG